MAARPHTGPAPGTWPEAWPALVPAPATGRRELVAAELAQGGESRPARVTALITGLAGTIGGQAATPDFVRRLSAGTREWLVQRLGATCRPAQDWFELTCAHCGATFDLSADLAAMPRSGPGPGFPLVTVETAAGPLAFDCLNGRHEEALAALPAPDLADMLALAARFEDAATVLAGLPFADLLRIEAALDEAAPEVADRIAATCPDCGASLAARIDPFDYAFPGDTVLLGEVHALSWAYKWSEAAILDLPSPRRRRYVGMVAAMART